MPGIVEEARGILAAAERDAEAGFAARAAAIERLEVHVLERLDVPAEVSAKAAALCRRLWRANVQVVRELRREIRAGRYAPETLRRELFRLAGPPGRPGGYDAMDLLAGGLLRAGKVGAEQAPREPEMVFYQPTPARAILALVERAGLGPEDLLYDLGSGLGQVVILAALLSGARAHGIEREPAYVEYARRSARRLSVAGVEFIEADAREASLAGGTVYFLYTPFRGAMLQQVVGRLEAEARQRPIRIATYGPCTAEIAATAGWLSDARAFSEHEVAVFHTRPHPS